MTKTTAPGSSSGAFVDDNPGGGIVGTLIVAADQNAHQDEIYNTIVGAAITPSGADNGQLWDAIRKAVKERAKEVGELFALSTRKTPVGFGSGTEDTYFPGLYLTDIASYLDISETNWPDLVPFLRGVKAIFKNGVSGEISSPGVTNWAIATNVATLTFTNDTDHVAFLTALSEDQTIHGSFTNWRTITLANAIGSITAGTYAITAINPASRTLSFAFTAANASGAVTATSEFYPHRIVGSTTTARVFSARGLTMHGVNDDNGYFVASALRRRGYMQGHKHNSNSYFVISNPIWNQADGSTAVAGTDKFIAETVSTSASRLNPKTSDPINDSTNGTPRTAKETNGPAVSVHLYIHGGRYVA
jgi:hypothetical protein